MSRFSDAIAEWDALAATERAGAKLAERWGDTSSYEVRARIAERTAEALRIQERTGIAVCSCCHKPLSETGYDDGRSAGFDEILEIMNKDFDDAR